MELKVLATSDLHLGMRFAGYPAMQAALTAARFETLARLVELANHEECGLFVIAGDLFHRLTVTQREIRTAAQTLAGFQGAVAAVLPGNHDFLAGPTSPLWKGFRESLEAAKADRVLLLDSPRRFALESYGLPVRLYAAPCPSKHGQENLVGWIAGHSEEQDGTERNVFKLGIAHGSIEGLSPDAQGEYFPMKRWELERTGLDLWIIGHTHRQHPETEAGDERILVPGTPEPDGFDCAHGGTAWLLEISGDKEVHRRSLATGHFRFRREELLVDEHSDPELLVKRYSGAEYTDSLLRLHLSGRASRERLQAVLQSLSGLAERLPWVEIDESGLSESISEATISGEFAQGSFAQRLLTRLLETGDQEALQEAYDLLQESRR
jgi:DNA repair exonuclease SbcCD nuclease subunit